MGAQILQRLGASLEEVRLDVLQRLDNSEEMILQASGEGHLVDSEQPHTNPAAKFEDRERLVLSFLADGATSRQIAETLGISTRKVAEITGSILDKLRRASNY